VGTKRKEMKDEKKKIQNITAWHHETNIKTNVMVQLT